VWILIAALPIGMFLGLIAGGSFTNLRSLSLRVWYLLIPAFAIMSLMAVDRNPPAEWLLLPVALVLFVIVALRNVAIMGMTIVGVGILANLVPVLINGEVPVRQKSVIQAGLANETNIDLVRLGAGRRFEEQGDYFVTLGAIIPFEPVKEVLTFGDLIVAAGLINVGFRAIKPQQRFRQDDEADNPAVTLAEALGIDPIDPLPASVPAPAVSAAPADPELDDAAPASSDADIFLDDLPDVVHGSATWGE
jgi:hypothetical protein